MATRQVRVDELMRSSGVGFGTSGARGRVEDLTDLVAYSYTLAFLQYLEDAGDLTAQSGVAIAGDYRPSTPRIMAAVAAAIEERGYRLINCGHIASPAVALAGLMQGIPSIMVTGSHIPDDRNGIKFNKPDGEILKQDEIAIKLQLVELDETLFDASGAFRNSPTLPEASPEAHQAYIRRYLEFFPPLCLEGLRIGLYEHSSVLRTALFDILQSLGAQVTKLGFSEAFLPVDTEAIRQEDVELARTWCADAGFDALVSADGDGDRPLISDEQGNWLRGDMVGILAASALAAEIAVTPVSSNTAVEKSGRFQEVLRTRIGSPFVIEAMQSAHRQWPKARVIGYEANGGFLTQTPISVDGRTLAALPTRDAVLPIIAILHLARQGGHSVSSLLAQLPNRFTYSDRIKDFPTDLSRSRLEDFTQAPNDALTKLEEFLGPEFATPASMDTTDGLRIVLDNEEIVHLRPSGNAPELRCYTEADSEARARQLNHQTMERLKTWL